MRIHPPPRLPAKCWQVSGPSGLLPSALTSHLQSRVPGKSLQTLTGWGRGNSPCAVPRLGRTRSHDPRRNAFRPHSASLGSPQFLMTAYVWPHLHLQAGVRPSERTVTLPGTAQGLPGLERWAAPSEGRGGRVGGGSTSCPQRLPIAAKSLPARGQPERAPGRPEGADRNGTGHGVKLQLSFYCQAHSELTPPFPQLTQQQHL